MGLLDRITGRIGGLLDEVALPESTRRILDDAEAAVERRDTALAERLLAAVERDRPGLWRTALLLGASREAAGDGRAAAAWYQRALQMRDAPALRFALARLAVEAGDRVAARAHLDAALERATSTEERVEALRGIADLLEASGLSDRALPHLRRALQLAPEHASLRVRVARALVAEGEDADAAEVLAPLVDGPLPHRDAALLVASLERKRATDASRARAERLLRDVVERDPGDDDALLALTGLLHDQGRVAEALPMLRAAALGADGALRAELRRRIAAALERGGQPEEAAAELELALIEEGERVALRTEIVALALRAERPELAIEHADPLLGAELEVDDRAALGRLLLALGDVDSARAALAPLRGRPGAAGQLALAELVLATGDPIEALWLVGELDDRTLAGAGQRVAEAAFEALTPQLPSTGPAPSVAELSALVDALGRLALGREWLADLAASLTAIARVLEQPLTVAVLGEFNAGKSTFLNAWLGEEALATGVLPTTAHVNVVRWGPRRAAVVTRHDGSVEELGYADAARLVRAEPDTIADIAIAAPHPDLRAVHFWDTPGFNSPDDAHEARAERALREAEAIVWLIDCQQALSQTEFDRIEQIEAPESRLLVVLNKADRLRGEPGALDQVRAHVESHLGNRRVGVFAVSASEALAARRVDPIDADAAGRSGWPALESAVRTAFLDHAARLKALDGTRQLRDALQAAIALTEARLAAIETARAGVLAAAPTSDRGAEFSGRAAPTVVSAWRAAFEADRRRLAEEVRDLVTRGEGLLGRRRLNETDAAWARDRLVARAERGAIGAVEAAVEAAAALCADAIGAVEAAADAVGPPDSRALQRRLERASREAELLGEVLRARVVDVWRARIEARVGEGVGLETLVETLLAPPQEVEAALGSLLPLPSLEWRDVLADWAEEYVAGVRSLSERVARDLELLALDLDRRIIRPLQSARTALDGGHAAQDSRE